MSYPELEKWLDTVTCVKPWGASDCVEFRQQIKLYAPAVGVEVYYTTGRDGQKVHVRVDLPEGSIRRTYDVV